MLDAAERTGGSYREEVLRQREVWQRKPVLLTIYQRWYARVVAALAAGSPTVEVGAGSGNFKEFHPQTIATDVEASGPWIDRVMDAHALDFPAGSLANLVAFDVIHHLQRPLDFLRQAERLLRPGGRLILCEPTVTPWSRLVYANHHETLDPSWPLFALAGTPPEPDPGHAFANMAIADLLFVRHPQETQRAVPGLRLCARQCGDFLLYPLSGGFSYRSLLIQPGLRMALAIEAALTAPTASWLTGLRQLVVLERVPVPAAPLD